MKRWEYAQIRQYFGGGSYIAIFLPDSVFADNTYPYSKKAGAVEIGDRRQTLEHLAQLCNYSIPDLDRVAFSDNHFLSALGHAGWELVTVLEVAGQNVLYLKRPIEDSDSQ